MKATHNGTCQICGRAQAVNARGIVAKHGYSVEMGFFSGVCMGADHRPLEVSTALLDEVVGELRARGERLMESTPEDFPVLRIELRGTRRRVGRIWVSDTVAVSSQEQIVELEQALKIYRGSTFPDRQRSAALRAIEQGRQLLQHVERMLELRGARHGADLYPREAA